MMTRRPHWVLAVVLLGPSVAASASKGSVHVSGTAYVVQHHLGRWGGVAPTREETEKLRVLNAESTKPRPVGKQRFLVRKGRENRDVRPSAEFVTEADGTFIVRLPPGTWCVVEESKK